MEVEDALHLQLSADKLEMNKINIVSVPELKTVGLVKLNCVDFFEDFNYREKKVPEAKKLGKHLLKYFIKRRFLFSKFDQGIQLDEESWYSVVAEPISLYLANRLSA